MGVSGTSEANLFHDKNLSIWYTENRITTFYGNLIRDFLTMKGIMEDRLLIAIYGLKKHYILVKNALKMKI